MSQQPVIDEARKHETGYKPDTPDDRDFVFARLLVSGGVTPSTPDKPYETVLFKPEILSQPTLDLQDLSAHSPGVYDQGYSVQSCVANGVAMAACYAWQKKPGENQDRITGTGDKLFDPSRWWIWYHAKRLDGGYQNQNAGCSIRNAIKAIHQYGCPPNSAWPYPALDNNYSRDVPYDQLQEDLKVNPDQSMYDIAKQNFVNDFEYYSIKTIGLDANWSWQGDVEPPAEASDRVIQMRAALAEGYPIIFAIGEFDVWDTQDRSATNGRWNKLFSPVWDRSNFTVGNIEGGLPDYDVIMKDLDPGFFPVNNPRLEIGNRHYGHVMLVIGSDPKRELFLIQNSYGLYDDMAKNVDKKPYFWMPYSYFRTKLIDATWVIRVKPGSTINPPQPPTPEPPVPSGVRVSIQFSDNFTGRNVNKDVLANVGQKTLSDVLFGVFDADGELTSIQLKGAKASAVAVIRKDGKVVGTARGSGNDYAQFERSQLASLTIEVTV